MASAGDSVNVNKTEVNSDIVDKESVFSHGDSINGHDVVMPPVAKDSNGGIKTELSSTTPPMLSISREGNLHENTPSLLRDANTQMQKLQHMQGITELFSLLVGKVDGMNQGLVKELSIMGSKIDDQNRKFEDISTSLVLQKEATSELQREVGNLSAKLERSEKIMSTKLIEMNDKINSYGENFAMIKEIAEQNQIDLNIQRTNMRKVSELLHHTNKEVSDIKLNVSSIDDKVNALDDRIVEQSRQTAQGFVNVSNRIDVLENKIDGVDLRCRQGYEKLSHRQELIEARQMELDTEQVILGGHVIENRKINKRVVQSLVELTGVIQSNCEGLLQQDVKFTAECSEIKDRVQILENQLHASTIQQSHHSVASSILRYVDHSNKHVNFVPISNSTPRISQGVVHPTNDNINRVNQCNDGEHSESADEGFYDASPKSQFGSSEPHSHSVVSRSGRLRISDLKALSRFSGDGTTESSQDFINKFLREMQFSGVPKAEFLSIVPLLLDGPAKSWFESYQGQIFTWEQFVIMLNETFDSLGMKASRLSALRSSRFNPREHKSVVDFVLERYQQLRSLDPFTAEEMRLRTIMDLLPSSVQSAVVGRMFNNIQELLRTVQDVETHYRKFKDKQQRSYNEGNRGFRNAPRNVANVKVQKTDSSKLIPPTNSHNNNSKSYPARQRGQKQPKASFENSNDQHSVNGNEANRDGQENLSNPSNRSDRHFTGRGGKRNNNFRGRGNGNSRNSYDHISGNGRQRTSSFSGNGATVSPCNCRDSSHDQSETNGSNGRGYMHNENEQSHLN